MTSINCKSLSLMLTSHMCDLDTMHDISHDCLLSSCGDSRTKVIYGFCVQVGHGLSF